jgi:hypothetical protein
MISCSYSEVSGPGAWWVFMMQNVVSHMDRRSFLALQRRIARKGQKLLHLQCSLWGDDVRREEGNLLLKHGFERHRPPRRVNGCSQYILELAENRRVCLWGFGLFYGEQSGIYVGRYEFKPRVACLRRNVWTPEEFKTGPSLPSTLLLEEAVRWIASYERWIDSVCGSSYRHICMYRAWEELAEDLCSYPRS